jgi:hypothetical protein
VSNQAEDGSEIAKMEGKNAFIRSVQNGSTTSEAKSDAIGASEDWYSARQAELVMENNLVTDTIANQVGRWESTNATGGTSNLYTEVDASGWPTATTGNVTLTLTNGTEMNARYLNLTSGQAMFVLGADVYPATANDGPMSTKDPDTSDTQILVRDPGNSKSINHAWDQLIAEEQATETELSTFADNAYTAIQNDEINVTDLVDPYLQSREYSPDSQYGSWAISTLTGAGYNGPLELSDTRNMTVQWNGTNKTGILQTDQTPSGGSFDIGTTYNATAIPGPQLLMSTQDGQTSDITGNFTVTSAHYANGTEINGSIDYETTDYNSSTVQGYKAKMDRYAERQAEIEARESALIGGGGFLEDAGIGAAGAVVVVAGVAWIARSQN